MLKSVSSDSLNVRNPHLKIFLEQQLTLKLMIHKGCSLQQFFFFNALGIFIKISTFLKGFHFLIFLFLPIYRHANFHFLLSVQKISSIEIDNLSGKGSQATINHDQISEVKDQWHNVITVSIKKTLAEETDVGLSELIRAITT